jgi:ribosomal protein S24E
MFLNVGTTANSLTSRRYYVYCITHHRRTTPRERKWRAQRFYVLPLTIDYRKLTRRTACLVGRTAQELQVAHDKSKQRSKTHLLQLVDNQYLTVHNLAI